MQSVEQVKNQIYSVPIPNNWREGQFVFNRVEELYGNIARKIQFEDGIDCFYNDDLILNFIVRVCERLNN